MMEIVLESGNLILITIPKSGIDLLDSFESRWIFDFVHDPIFE